LAAAHVRPLKVLIVDDLVDAAEALARLLRFDAHEVRTAYRGSDAIAAARELAPEVVLLDLGLPGLNGYEVARQMREQAGCRGAIIIAITGRTQARDRERAAEAAIDDYLLKPVRIEELQAALARFFPG
jgi:DNA-binding response OmpR family regulator